MNGAETKLQPADANAPRQLLRLVIAVVTGGLTGAVIGAGVIGYTSLLQELSAFNTRWEVVAVAAFVGGFGGALVGVVVGLITGLILVTRNRSGESVRLR